MMLAGADADRTVPPMRAHLEGGPRCRAHHSTLPAFLPGDPATPYRRGRRLAALQVLHEVRLLPRAEPEAEAAVVVVDDVEQRLEATVVVEAALRAGGQGPQRGRHVGAVGPAVGLEGVGADLRRLVGVVARLGADRAHVAAPAASGPEEDLLAARRRSPVEAAARRPRARE